MDHFFFLFIEFQQVLVLHLIVLSGKQPNDVLLTHLPNSPTRKVLLFSGFIFKLQYFYQYNHFRNYFLKMAVEKT